MEKDNRGTDEPTERPDPPPLDADPDPTMHRARPPLAALHNNPIWGLAGIAQAEIADGESVDGVVYP